MTRARRSDSCLDCQADLAGTHHNRTRCPPCAARLLNRPAHNLTEDQQLRVRELAGTMPQDELWKAVGARSRSSVIRFAMAEKISLRQVLYSPELIARVLECYEAHGKTHTQKMFPTVALRSIVEHRTYRHHFAPRQSRFTHEDYRLLVRMAGLVPYDMQAQHLQRPRAHAGSIRSFWVKNLPVSATSLQGIDRQTAKYICERDVPFIRVPPVQRPDAAYGRSIVLWSDAALYLLPEVPAFIREAVEAMAAFQRWVYETDTPQVAIHDIVDWVQATRAESRQDPPAAPTVEGEP